MTSPSRVRWPWARWSLARQLPLITAAIVVLVMGLSLTVTYQALVQARSDTLRSRIQGLLGVLIQAGENGVKTRVTVLHQFGKDTTLVRAVTAPAGGAQPAKDDSAAAVVLQKIAVPTDSGLPVELWTVDGRRVAHVGVDVRGDSIAALPPELRSRRGTHVSEVPQAGAVDTGVQIGALYPSDNHVFFWTVAPVLREGKRVGAIVQQRRIVSNPQVKQMIRDLSGEEFTVYLRNTTDNFWSSVDGHPVSPPVRRDTTEYGFLAKHLTGEPQLGVERRVRGSPYIYVLEAPRSAIVAAPRQTLRRLALVSVLLLIGGVAISWALARQITRPLVELATATEEMAQGLYGRRVTTDHSASDEVQRLGASFNRMATEVQASQHELASQVEEALSTSEQLEHTNEQLQHASSSAAEARDAALDANRAKSDFLAVMSHELRTPLNAIGGYTEILQLGIYGELNQQQRDALQRVERSQQTLLSLINDVLNFAKLESGEVRYAISDVQLGTTLDTIDDFIAPQLRDRRLTYSVQPCEAGVTVRADGEKLQQILINLLSNAVKYTPEGGSIDVRCEVVGDTV
ncbi:MAG: ATP-binding region ATPase domain protein, partial [Gemmatimonadetes bacterium]|nr:ATP-binding region ATPase domain protein [Gemmatimonadota bacterium]